MSTKAPVSLCIIVKDEPLLERCLLSIRDHVEEIVVIDTGSKDQSVIDIAKKYADIFEIYTECNDQETGLIEDFSKARQKSFDLATKQFIMWADADDLITGGENLNTIINSCKGRESQPIVFMFPYEYAYDELNQCTCLHYRERLICNKNNFHWTNPVHEVLIPNDNINATFITTEQVIWKHQRQYSTKGAEPGRNLRILRKHFEKVGESDARQMYYLGLECCNSGLIDESIKLLSRYIDVSGWDDERAMACLKLVEIYMGRGDYENGMKWAFKTISIKETWGEGYFCLGKMFYFLAQAGGPNEMRNWERCVYFIRTGLSLPATKTLLFINPLDRDLEIHRYFNMALNKVNRIHEALDSVNIALKSKPNDASLILNKRIYESFLTKQQANEIINKLKELGELDESSTKLVSGVIHKTISPVSVSDKNVQQLNSQWSIPNTYDLRSPIQKLPINQLQSISTMLWQQYMLYDDIDSAVKFLENAPSFVKSSFLTEKALLLTKKYLSREVKSEKEKLDIVFFCGNAFEIWSPSTVEKTGIGGSELMVLNQAKNLARLGHSVRVYNSCGNMEGIYDGVQYLLTEKYHDLECDILIVSRRADMLGDQYNITSKLKLLYVHDVWAICSSNELLLKADRILALSPWHKQNLINVHCIHPDHIITTRNGVDLKRFEKNIIRNRFKCINSSSPDRSYPILLELWPKIKEQVPEATLTLAYGFKNWELSAQNDQNQLNLIMALKTKIEKMKILGVTYIDRVNQDRLAEEFLSSGAWIHPTWFTETSCISAMEAQLSGLKIITSNLAALQTTVGERGVLIDGDWTSEEYKNKFVNEVVKALTCESDESRIKLQQYAKDNFGLESLAKEWETMFYQLIEEIKYNPINPYQPTIPYQANGRGYWDGDTRYK